MKQIKEKETKVKELKVLVLASLQSSEIQKAFKEYVFALFPEVEKQEQKELQEALEFFKELMTQR